VKADTLRIDHGEQSISPMAASLRTALTETVQTRHGACGPIRTAKFSSTQLYVWHCALLI
jgi:hypothetical protein